MMSRNDAGQAPPLNAMVFLLLAAVLTAAGCGDSGPRRYQVSGRVTYGGKPLDKGEIIFTPTDDAPQPDGGKIVDGRFSFRSLPGKKRVEIRAERLSDTRKIPVCPDPEAPNGAIEWIPAMENYIPDRYNIESELQIEVRADGDRYFEFALQE